MPGVGGARFVRFLLIFAVSASWACAEDPNGQTGGAGGGDGDAPVQVGDIAPIWVNEVMAQNTSTWQDEGGAFPDWIELWNPNAEPVDLSGWWMSDDRDEPFDWQIPDGVVIAPDEHLVVYCDGDAIEGELHASFKLASAGGEDVALFGPNVLDNPLVDAVEDLGPQLPDQSLARTSDGGNTWELDPTPTPGAPNEL